MGVGRSILMWLVVFLATTAFFYGVDHAVMAAQGLPLSWDLTPAR